MTEYAAPPKLTCAAHRYHRPKPLTAEFHHVVPQAWQALWTPHRTTTLWEPKTVPLCPTGHRNVHRYIVALMEAAKELQTESPLAARKHAFGDGRLTHEQVIALRALTLWKEAGGSLQTLIEWGQMGRGGTRPGIPPLPSP